MSKRKKTRWITSWWKRKRKVQANTWNDRPHGNICLLW